MSDRIKYPRTPHLPWSPGGTGDDAYLVDVSHFEGRDVVVTEKMDGENTTLYRNGMHARSLDSRHHVSRDWIKTLQVRLADSIPEGWRLCGENLYARHAIAYESLPSFFMLFSIWDEQNTCLSWAATCEWATLLDLVCVPELYCGPWDERSIQALPIDPTRQEGYVVRITDPFPYDEFPRSVAKWVRPCHVQTDQHWMHRTVVPNRLTPS